MGHWNVVRAAQCVNIFQWRHFWLCFCHAILRGVNFRLKKICVCNLSAHRVHIAFSFATPGLTSLGTVPKPLSQLLESPRRSCSKINFSKVASKRWPISFFFYASEIFEAWPDWSFRFCGHHTAWLSQSSWSKTSAYTAWRSPRSSWQKTDAWYPNLLIS